ncbi:dihydrolipoamide acetyltransferase family protein [Streptomyces sp. NPDC001634]|uniref:dihydrolipoamide acetyltransferase family protein n=1 Tax=Streptomyces sp. NPDC001634 TaxID=3154390 RepID=UPI00331E0EB4
MDVTMPQLGETVAEATVTRWLKQPGDAVDEGEPLFEVATDKVDTEIPASAGGTLSEILVAVDQTVPVGTRVAVINGPGEERGPSDSAQAAVTVPEPPSAAPTRAARNGSLSPLVRKLLAEHELRPDQVTGTGPGGRITRGDVAAAVARRGKAASAGSDSTEQARRPPIPQAVPAVQSTPAAAAPTGEGAGSPDGTLVPFTSIRRRTAEHMVRSKATSAHTLMAVEVDYSAVDRVRKRRSEEWRRTEGFGLSYLPFVSRAVVDALGAYPHLNASVHGDGLLLHREVHLGIAVDLDADGLVVPVIRSAGGKRLRRIAQEVSEYAARARAGRLRADELGGGTFTISNPGPYGTSLTVPIINQPQVAILATDSVRPSPVAVPTGSGGEYALAVRPVGNVALSFDHRAVDGAYAARFLAEVRKNIEERNWDAEF